MIHRLILSPDAKADFRSAFHWYADKDKNLSLRFRTDFKATLKLIAQYPSSFPRLRGLVRRAVMKRFPYSVYFTFSGGTVYVLRILHQRQLNLLSKP
jgi:toxin ParE1/3/4